MAYPRKLTQKETDALIEALKDPQASVTALAKQFGIGTTTVYKYIPPERRRPGWKIEGRTFGRWTVLKRDDEESNRTGVSRYWCRCECKAERSVLRKELVQGASTMCRECRDKEGEG